MWIFATNAKPGSAARPGRARRAFEKSPRGRLQRRASASARISPSTDQGLQRLRRAVALLDRAGIAWETPNPIKPAAELLGEMLLFAGRPQEAVKAFEAALERRPARVLSLRGLARANVELGYNKTAKDYYRRLADQLRDADHDDAVLAEAKRFLDRPKWAPELVVRDRKGQNGHPTTGTVGRHHHSPVSAADAYVIQTFQR